MNLKAESQYILTSSITTKAPTIVNDCLVAGAGAGGDNDYD